MIHKKQFLTKYWTQSYGIVQVLDKLDHHPITKIEGLWYKVRKQNNHNEYVLQITLKNIIDCTCVSDAQEKSCRDVDRCNGVKV